MQTILTYRLTVPGLTASCAVADIDVFVGAGQFILPVTVTIHIWDSLLRCIQRSSSVGMLHLAENIAASVAVVRPGSVRVRIIYTDQLAQDIVGIRRSQRAALLGDDISLTIAFLFEGNMSPVGLFTSEIVLPVPCPPAK